MTTAEGDPVEVTRRSYALIAEDYARRNTVPLADFAAWRDAWVDDVRASSGGVAAGAAGRGDPEAGLPLTAAPRVPRVLDAGCGPGHCAAAFRDAGLRAVAFDLSDAMLAIARDRGVPVVLGDLRRLPFADRAFDGVWSSAALLHVPREHAPATLREWHRVSARGAALALSTASGGTDGWEDPPYDTRGERPPPRWFTYHDEGPLLALLEGAGWGVASVDTYRSHRTWLRVRAVAA